MIPSASSRLSSAQSPSREVWRDILLQFRIDPTPSTSKPNQNKFKALVVVEPDKDIFSGLTEKILFI
jgi:hypothetical protein